MAHRDEKNKKPQGREERTAEERVNNLLFRIVVNLDYGSRTLERGGLSPEDRSQTIERMRAAREDALAIGDIIKSNRQLFDEKRCSPTRESFANKLKVFVIDDEPMIAKIFHRLVGSRGEVVGLTSFDGARKRIEEEYEAILFCDLHMPGASTLDFLAWLQAEHPRFLRRTYLITGGLYSNESQEIVAEYELPVLYKPFDRDEVERILCRHI